MINPKDVSACLITKDPIYPRNLINWLSPVGFGEILIMTNCDSPHRKQELFAKAKHDYLYYNDDDCLPPAREVLAAAEPGMLTCAMKPNHLKVYAQSRIALVGWGAVFPKRTIDYLDEYRLRFGEDALYKRETERIMTHLSFDEIKQKRLDLPIIDGDGTNGLPNALGADRLSMQPGHYNYIPAVERRCATILESQRREETLVTSVGWNVTGGY